MGNIPHVDKVIDSKGRHQPASKSPDGNRPVAQLAKVAASDAPFIAPTVMGPADAAEVANLASGLRVALAGLDPPSTGLPKLAPTISGDKPASKSVSRSRGQLSFCRCLRLRAPSSTNTQQ